MTRRKISRGVWLLLIAVLISLPVWTTPVHAQTPTPENQVIMYLFWGEGCPHCAKAKPYLESLPVKYPGLVLKSYEVYYNQENQVRFARMAQKFGVEQLAVPTFFIGPYYQQGYSEQINPQIEAVIVQCLQENCADAGEGIMDVPVEIPPTITPSPTPELLAALFSTPTLLAAETSTQPTATLSNLSPVTSTPIPPQPTEASTLAPRAMDQSHTLEIPLLGSVNLDLQSITLSTVLIAFVDGINPCSIWVLTMLLALTLHTGSRRKVVAISLIFLTVTAAIYALFIAGLFSVLKIASFMGWIQIVVALIALFFALVNIKDYFWYKEGISFTIADDQKPGIFKRMRAVMDASQSFWGLIGATVVMAAGVSLVEFSCTAGFPILWTNLLTAQKVSVAAFIGLLLVYMLIYQLDELVIFFSAVASLKVSRIEEKQGRLLKLVGGMLMLTLSAVMLINPALMNNLASSLLIFGAAIVATLLILLIHQVILPKFGIRIGTEPGKKPKGYAGKE
jgi:thiol-disulfide isomerase/thioredoxin